MLHEAESRVVVGVESPTKSILQLIYVPIVSVHWVTKYQATGPRTLTAAVTAAMIGDTAARAGFTAFAVCRVLLLPLLLLHHEFA